jgi:hypothetical protein
VGINLATYNRQYQIVPMPRLLSLAIISVASTDIQNVYWTQAIRFSFKKPYILKINGYLTQEEMIDWKNKNLK